MTDADKFFKSTKNQLIGLEVLVGAHLLATLVFGKLAYGQTPNPLVNIFWAVLSTAVIVVSVALAANIFKESIKNSSDKQLKEMFGAVIGLLVVHGVVSVICLFTLLLRRYTDTKIYYILSGLVIVVIGILLVVLNVKNDITSLLS